MTQPKLLENKENLHKGTLSTEEKKGGSEETTKRHKDISRNNQKVINI